MTTTVAPMPNPLKHCTVSTLPFAFPNLGLQWIFESAQNYGKSFDYVSSSIFYESLSNVLYNSFGQFRLSCFAKSIKVGAIGVVVGSDNIGNFICIGVSSFNVIETTINAESWRLP